MPKEISFLFSKEEIVGYVDFVNLEVYVDDVGEYVGHGGFAEVVQRYNVEVSEHAPAHVVAAPARRTHRPQQLHVRQGKLCHILQEGIGIVDPGVSRTERD